MPFMTPKSLLQGYRIYNETVPGNSEHFVDSVHFTDYGAELMAQRVFTGLDASAKVQQVLAVSQ